MLLLLPACLLGLQVRRVDSVLLQSEAKNERRYADMDIEISTTALPYVEKIRGRYHRKMTILFA